MTIPLFDEQAILAEIRSLYHDTPLKIGRLLLQLRRSEVYKPGSFVDYCAEQDLPLGPRESTRLIAHTHTSDLCFQTLHVRPANRYISRILSPVALSPKWLQAVEDHLQQRGYTLAAVSNGKLQTASGAMVRATILTVVPARELKALRFQLRSERIGSKG